MKNEKLTLLFILFFFSLIAKAQNRTYGQEYCISTQKPIAVYLGETIFIPCDTMYLINKGRYDFYKKMHGLNLDREYISYSSLLKKYEDQLSEHKNSYQKLVSNCKKSELKNLNTLKNTKT